jgi:Tfp pilus assembly protein PilF
VISPTMNVALNIIDNNDGYYDSSPKKRSRQRRCQQQPLFDNKKVVSMNMNDYYYAEEADGISTNNNIIYYPGHERRRIRRSSTTRIYRLTFISSVFLLQLVRVHSWNSSPSSMLLQPPSTIKKSLVVGDSFEPLLLMSLVMEQQQRENLSSSSKNNIRIPSSIPLLKRSSSNHNNGGPSMLLGEDFFFPISSSSSSTASITSSSSQKSPIIIDENNNNLLIENKQQQRKLARRGVLGFDIRHSESSSSSSSSLPTTSESNEDVDTTQGLLTWENAPLSPTTTTSTMIRNRRETSSSSGAGGSATVAASGGVRLVHSIPAWFPWVPTKEEIMTLKLKELKEACSERGLMKSGNKDVLQERLWGWTSEHQMEQKTNLESGGSDHLTSWFEDTASNFSPSSILRRRRQQQQEELFVEEVVEEEEEESNTPNSLAEWTRSAVDSEKLTQKRQEIHRQKRVGKKPPSTDDDTDNDSDNKNTSNIKNNNKNKNNRADAAAAKTKEYLLKLTNAMKTSPSSPYASNKEVKELYDASKKADQLGEPLLAIQLLDSLLQVTPNDARIYRRLSRMHREQDNLNLARSTLQDGLRKLPKNPWLWHGLGQLELSIGRTEVGIKCYQRAITEDITFAHSYHAWGIHEFSNGQIAKAMKILKKGIEYCPTNHRLHHALGDLYRGAKLPKDAERSYRRSIEEGPSVSHSFAYSALACVAYEQGDVDEARRWLYRSIETNDGRHAQGWLALAQIEEAEGDVEKALTVCEASIIRYEKGLLEARQRYKQKGSSSRSRYNNNVNNGQRKTSDELDIIDKFPKDPTTSNVIEEGLLRSIPKYRSGDKFLGVYRHWARLEGRYGTYDNTNRVYERASTAFPFDYKISLDWARYHSKLRNVERAQSLYTEACNRASRRHHVADPYREYAAFEMDLGQYEQARNILFLGAQKLTPLRSSSYDDDDGGVGNNNNQKNNSGLAQLYVTWAVCEWHLQNIPRAEALFDHALQLADVGDDDDEGSELRSFILYCMARLEYYERQEIHLAQHCIGLSLKGEPLPGNDNNAPVWELWAEIADYMDNPHLEEECLKEATKCKNIGGGSSPSSALETMNMLKGSQKMKNIMRQEPWHDKLQTVRGINQQEEKGGGQQNESSDVSSSSSCDFYSKIDKIIRRKQTLISYEEKRNRTLLH